MYPVNKYAHFINKLINKFQSSIYYKVFFLMLISGIIHLFIYIVFSVSISSHYIDRAKIESKKYIIDNIINLMESSMSSEAKVIELKLKEIENVVKILQLNSSNILNNLNDYSYLNSKSEIKKNELGYLYSDNSNSHSAELSNCYISSKTEMTPVLMEKILKLKNIDNTLKAVVDNNSSIVLGYILLKENAIRTYPKLDYPELVNKNMLFPPDLELKNYEFFYSADENHNPEKDITWTHIYKDITTRGLIITCNAPVYSEDGNLIAVVGIDVMLDTIVTNFLNINFKQPSAYSALITSHNEVILNNQDLQDQIITNSNTLDKDIWLFLNNANKEFEILKDYRNEKLIMYHPAAHWKLIYVIPEEEIFAPFAQNIKQLLNDLINFALKYLIIFIFTMLILWILLSFLFSKKITKPIKELTYSVNALSNGRLEKVKIKSSDEIAILSESFNQMSILLSDNMKKLKTKAIKEERLNEELKQLNHYLDSKVKERTNELMQVNDELKINIEKISIIEQSRRELLNNVSHELRTPLMIIQGYIELIKNDQILNDDEYNIYLDKITDKCNLMNRLIKDLFSLSQLEVGQSIDFKLTDLKSVLQQYFDDEVDILSEKEKVKFTYILPKEIPHVIIDADRIVQVLYNIVQNAIKYTKDKIAVKVTVIDNKAIKFDINDNGIGIAEDDLPYIFNRFYKGKNNKGGSGIGLAVTKAIIEAHGGTIWVESSQGEGTTFYFLIPIKTI